jgi:hypothetical protein
VLTDDVRTHCAAIAAHARHVRIDPAAAVPEGGTAGLDPGLHYLDGAPEEIARYVLILDALNFGSGWFAELGTSTDALTARLTAHADAKGPWTAGQLRAATAAEAGAVLGLDPLHELTGLYARALNQLGDWLGDGPLALGGSAEAFAERLTAMPFFADVGFYKRAQIAAHDLFLARVADYPDIGRLTIFADNLVPHVLRHFGVLVYDDELAARVDAGEELAQGSREEAEIRACAVHACEGLAAGFGVPPATLDNWLWNRGAGLDPTHHPNYRPHVTRTVYY